MTEIDRARRALLCGGSVFLLGCLSRSDGGIEHTIQVLNKRETTHEIELLTRLGSSEEEFGPRSVSGDTNWTAAEYDQPGTLSIECYVDSEQVWSDEYDIPMDEYDPGRE